MKLKSIKKEIKLTPENIGIELRKMGILNTFNLEFVLKDGVLSLGEKEERTLVIAMPVEQWGSFLEKKLKEEDHEGKYILDPSYGKDQFVSLNIEENQLILTFETHN